MVEETGAGGDPRLLGRRMGAAWLAWTCGRCAFCLSGRENLCDAAAFTGYTRDGGFASHMLAEAAYLYPLPQDGAAGKAECAASAGPRQPGGAHPPAQ
ncbi:alcohol dehydrogenase catalytic domain-containing protein [Achromobacter ruhlandii]|uniref:alcohol dehydrogenase catalytic domain-containing protein n=1 Tax=Achromobacter ruhlandii TaxID=72557 RepID=UPI003211AB4A